MWVIRTDTTGKLDPTFGTPVAHGVVEIAPGGAATPASTDSVNVASDDTVVVAGSDDDAQLGSSFYLVRLRADGTMDNTFGVNGVASESPILSSNAPRRS